MRTYLVAESPTDLNNPVEVLLTRGDLPPFAPVSTVNGGDIWVAPYDAATGQFGTFEQKVDGATGSGLCSALSVQSSSPLCMNSFAMPNPVEWPSNLTERLKHYRILGEGGSRSPHVIIEDRPEDGT